MFILSLFTIEFLFFLTTFIELLFCYVNVDYEFDTITIGSFPNIYSKVLSNIKFTLGLIPLAFHHSLKSFSVEKSEKLKYWQMALSVLPIFVIHSFVTIYFLGVKEYLAFYKSLITFDCNYFSHLYMTKIVNLFDLHPLHFFAIAVSTSTLLILFYFIVIKNFLLPTLSLILGILRVPVYNFFAIAITYSTIIYLFVKSEAKNLFLILKYDSLTFWFIDIFIAHAILILLMALTLEILSRISKEKSHSTL